MAMVCDNDTPDDCFILEICVVLIIEFLIYIFILLSSFQTMFFKVKISMEVFEKNNTREKKISSEKKKIKKYDEHKRNPIYLFIIQKAFESLPFILENELDWPEFSTVTGTIRGCYVG